MTTYRPLYTGSSYRAPRFVPSVFLDLDITRLLFGDRRDHRDQVIPDTRTGLVQP
jgi:hypothetical protein